MAVGSEVQICNLALLRLGASPITSMEEASTSSVVCKASYAHARDMLLRQHFWNFATKRIALAADAIPPQVPNWNSQFTLPSDFVRLKTLYNTDASHFIEGDKILSNASAPLHLVYIAQINDPTMFEPLFVEALVLSIVKKIGARIRGDTFDELRYEGLYQDILMTAKTADSQDNSAISFQANTLYDASVGGDWLGYY